MNILVLDDEKEIADLVALYLEMEEFKVYKFYDSESAIKTLDEINFDLAILDVMISGIDGFSLVKMIRNKGLKFPIIMLTAKILEEDKVTGLSLGADDYITKPFNPMELIARVKAQLRRYIKYNDKKNVDKIIVNGLEIDKSTHTCKLYNKDVVLTPTEFDILLFLLLNRGRVVSSEELFQSVWKEKYLDNNNTVMVHIRRIREKLNDNTKNPKFIKTVWGVGYKIDEE